MSYTDADGNGSIDPSTEIVDENNHYPFGLQHRGYNSNVSSLGSSTAKKWKYNGVEFEESLGLDLYEMDFRQYDPAIGRFTGIDPVVHHSMSTYTAFDNNPAFWADPSGANSEKDDPFRSDVERAKENKPEWDHTISSNAGGTNGGGSGCCPNRYRGSGVAIGDNVVNELDGVTITPNGATATQSGGWTTESERYGYSGTPSQYQEEYGYSREGWEIEHGADWRRLVAQWDKEEQNRRTLEKLTFFLAVASNAPIGPPNPGGIVPARAFNFKGLYAPQPQIHGNSLLSPKPTWFYKLYSNDGTFLKNGITNKLVPESRYTRSFMSDKYMDDLILFPNRRQAYDFEFGQNQIQRGPLNLNMH